MKLFSADQIREIDRFTIENEPIKSIDLMERAASSIYSWFSSNIEKSTHLSVFCGPGNNGGDGLVLARLLKEARYNVEVCYLDFSDVISPDCEINMKRLESLDITIYRARQVNELPVIHYDTIIVDAIFGTGLTRNLDGFPADAVKHLNSTANSIIALDIPSGLFSDYCEPDATRVVIKASITLTLEFPKISFFMADNAPCIGQYVTLPIGLHPRAIREMSTQYQSIDIALVRPMLKKIGKFDHKGTNGHGLIVAGSCGKVGASVLASRAALRAGIGLLTVHVHKPSAAVIHNSVPEAMVQCDQSEILISEVYDIDRYDSIGIGPGIGTKPNTVKALEHLLTDFKKPMVIDADALNIISEHSSFVGLLTPNTILTPHPGEFDRLVGSSDSSYQRLVKQVEYSNKTGSIVVLKGANTSVSLPDGRVWFNTSGNPGMATAGAGDVLTGIILSLISQGYSQSDSAIIGVFIHGLAGDIAAEKYGYESLIASDIINNIGESYNRIRNR